MFEKVLGCSRELTVKIKFFHNCTKLAVLALKTYVGKSKKSKKNWGPLSFQSNGLLSELTWQCL